MLAIGMDLNYDSECSVTKMETDLGSCNVVEVAIGITDSDDSRPVISIYLFELAISILHIHTKWLQ